MDNLQTMIKNMITMQKNHNIIVHVSDTYKLPNGKDMMLNNYIVKPKYISDITEGLMTNNTIDFDSVKFIFHDQDTVLMSLQYIILEARKNNITLEDYNYQMFQIEDEAITLGFYKMRSDYIEEARVKNSVIAYAINKVYVPKINLILGNTFLLSIALFAIILFGLSKILINFEIPNISYYFAFGVFVIFSCMNVRTINNDFKYHNQYDFKEANFCDAPLDNVSDQIYKDYLTDEFINNNHITTMNVVCWYFMQLLTIRNNYKFKVKYSGDS